MEEFSLKQIHQSIRRKYPRESPEQLKVRIQKMYEKQIEQLFVESDDNMSTEKNSLPDDEPIEN